MSKKKQRSKQNGEASSPQHSAAKPRLDQAVVTAGLASSRSQAAALIMAGRVLVGGQVANKAGVTVAADAEITLSEQCPWVSRGGYKLAHGLEYFEVNPTGMTAIDVGCSTGGFTDVLLQGGAEKVFAVDVGHGQLDWNLRQDDRVVVLEKTNARYLTAEHVPEMVDLVVCDASFISLTKVLPAAMALTKPGAWVIALIKPQFEAGEFAEGRDAVNKGKGVIRDEAIQQETCDRVVAWLGEQGWTVQGVTKSPITGPKGNVEFLVGAVKRVGSTPAPAP